MDMGVMDRFRIDGKVAVVTGGTKGIGGAIAVALAEAGAHIAAVSRNPSAEIEKAVNRLGCRFMHHPADLTIREEARKVIPAVLVDMGDVDILVNNAGICPRSPVETFPEEDWDATLEIDLSAAFILSRAAARVMLEKGGGKIINIASVLAFQGGLNVPAYAASKHGIVGLTKAMANQWAARNINVNAIAPGYFSTDLIAALQGDPERSKALLSRVPARRWGEPEELGGVAVLLASPASDFVNGSVIAVDGGWLSG